MFLIWSQSHGLHVEWWIIHLLSQRRYLSTSSCGSLEIKQPLKFIGLYLMISNWKVTTGNLLCVRKIYPYFSFLFTFRCAVIHHKTSNNFTFKIHIYIYIHILVSKMLLFKHPINKKTLVRMDIWNAIPHMPTNFRKRSDNWRLRIYPLRYATRKIRWVMILTTSNIIHSDRNILFTHTANKNTNRFPLDEFTEELSS